MLQMLKVFVGAAIGGIVGYYVWKWMLSQGFYALAVPGGLLGVGAGFFKNRSIVAAIVCGIAAFALGVFSEWRQFPFSRLNELGPVTWLMILVGTAIGFWGPYSNLSRTKAKPGAK
jgi:hypothetical protein